MTNKLILVKKINTHKTETKPKPPGPSSPPTGSSLPVRTAHTSVHITEHKTVVHTLHNTAQNSCDNLCSYRHDEMHKF